MDLILHLHSVICFIGYLFLWSNILVQRFLFIRLSGFGTMHLSRCISSNTNFDDPFFCVICSLHLSLYTAAWVTFNGVGSNRACCLLQLFSLECFVFIFLSRLSFFSLFLSPHSLDRVSYSLYLKKLQIESISERARSRVSGRSRAGVLVFVCFVSNSSFAFRS